MQYCMLHFELTPCRPFLIFIQVIYLNHSKRESKWLQATGEYGNGTTGFLTLQIYPVHFIFLLDTVQSVLVMDDLFYWFVYHFSDYNSLGHFNYAVVDGPFLDAIIMFTVQVVYCWRVWRLGGWKVLPAAAVFASFFQHWSWNSEVDQLMHSSRSLRVSVEYLSAFMWVSSLHYSSPLTGSQSVIVDPATARRDKPVEEVSIKYSCVWCIW